jgi:hypothetical protein
VKFLAPNVVGGLREVAMRIDAKKSDRLAGLATEIFDCMAQAYHEQDFEVADRLFRVWIKLPHPDQTPLHVP